MKLVKKLLILTAVLFVTILFIVSFIIVMPQTVINTTTLKWVNEKFYEELHVDWGKVEINISKVSLLENIFTIKGKYFCTNLNEMDICLSNLEVTLKNDLKNPLNIDFQTFILKDEKIRILFPNKEEKQKVESGEIALDEVVQGALPLIEKVKSYYHKFNQLRIELNNTVIQFKDEKYHLEANIHDDEINLSLKASSFACKASFLKNSKNELEGTLSFTREGLLLNSKTIIGENLKTSSAVHVTMKKSKVESSPNINHRLNVMTDLSHQTFHLSLTDIQLDPSIAPGEFHIPSCKIRLPLKPSGEKLELICKEVLFVFPLNKIAQFRNNKKLLTKMQIQFKVFGEFSNVINLNKKAYNWGRIQVEGNSLNDDFWNFSTNAILGIELDSGNPQIKINDFNWEMKVKSFQTIVKKLSGTSNEIPAPFNSLVGSVSFFSKSKNFIFEKDKIEIPFQVSVDLDQSKHNKIQLTTEGIYEWTEKKKIKSFLKLNVNIRKFYFYIPSFDPIKGLPSIQADNRFKTKEIKQTKKSKNNDFDYQVIISTSSFDSIRFYYHLFDPYFSFKLKASLAPHENSFQLMSDTKTTIEYLKRSTDLVKFQYIPASNSPLLLHFLYVTGGYKIHLKIVGTLDDPQLLLKSSPSLPREDIISLLLYGRRSNQISSFQKESVGGTGAAISDRAFGLLSLWLFASTPIDHVSYNSANQTYSAQISLPAGTTFEVGSDWEHVNTLSFRKRLSDTWSFVTSYHPGNLEDGIGDLFLQKRFNFD